MSILSLIGFCQHVHSMWSHEGGNLLLVCSDCGRPVPALKRGQRESRLVRSGDQAGTLQAQRVTPQVSEKVTHIRRRG